MRESIFYASLRSFFLVLFGVAGFVVGFLLIAAAVGSIFGTVDNSQEISYKYATSIQPNANGVRKALSASAPVILKINVHGVIGAESLTQESIRQQLIESREQTLKNNRVKALLLHLETPGGTVFDADGIYRAIKAYKEEFKVPVYAYVDGLCASGGMYVAAAADKVFASDVSLIGSVGVVSPPFMNFSQLLDKIGVQSETLFEGKGKDNMNPFRPWRKDEDENLKEVINYYYNSFVDLVVANRPKLSREKLVDVYGANIYPAALAKEYGYIDENGHSYGDTLKLLAKEIGVEDDEYQVIELQSTNWFSELFRSEMNLFKGKVIHQVSFSPETDPKLQNQFLYLYRP
ncbi:MAG: S49 family peptidase [Parachlamydiaceae bacterium]|nr:S49 family peptidase [Parachlamydiaceae bacterium]